MSYHFHKLRRRRAAQKAVEAHVCAAAAEIKEEPIVKPEAAQKATKSRRKGDA